MMLKVRCGGAPAVLLLVGLLRLGTFLATAAPGQLQVGLASQ